MEWVAAYYGITPPERVIHIMTVEQIALRYYLGHKDEARKMNQQAQLTAMMMFGARR